MVATENHISPAGSRGVTVCVNSYDRMVPVGAAYLGGKRRSFNGAIELLRYIDDYLDQTGYPEPYTFRKSFAGESGGADPPEGEVEPQAREEGRIATFFIKVLFRQNASWQGSVLWKEGRAETSFRSVLELVHLMDSAVRQ